MPEIKLFKPKDDKKTDTNDKKEKKVKKISLQKGSLFGKSRGKMPTKTTINLAIKEEEAVSLRRLLPGLILAVLLVIFLGKTFVFDRVAAMLTASNEVTQMQSQLEAAYSTIASYDEIEDDYAHYTYSGMTEEELNRVDRVSVMALVRQVMQAGVTTRNWSLTENELTIQVTGTSLQTLNELSKRLESNPIVDRCVITTANKKEIIDPSGNVDVSYVIYLQKPQEESEDNANTTQGTDDSQDTGTGQYVEPTGRIQDIRGKEAVS